LNSWKESANEAGEKLSNIMFDDKVPDHKKVAGAADAVQTLNQEMFKFTTSAIDWDNLSPKMQDKCGHKHLDTYKKVAAYGNCAAELTKGAVEVFNWMELDKDPKMSKGEKDRRKAGKAIKMAASIASIGTLMPPPINIASGIVGGLFSFVGGFLDPSSQQSEESKKLDALKEQLTTMAKDIKADIEKGTKEVKDCVVSQSREVKSCVKSDGKRTRKLVTKEFRDMKKDIQSEFAKNKDYVRQALDSQTNILTSSMNKGFKSIGKSFLTSTRRMSSMIRQSSDDMKRRSNDIMSTLDYMLKHLNEKMRHYSIPPIRGIMDSSFDAIDVLLNKMEEKSDKGDVDELYWTYFVTESSQHFNEIFKGLCTLEALISSSRQGTNKFDTKMYWEMELIDSHIIYQSYYELLSTYGSMVMWYILGCPHEIHQGVDLFTRFENRIQKAENFVREFYADLTSPLNPYENKVLFSLIQKYNEDPINVKILLSAYTAIGGHGYDFDHLFSSLKVDEIADPMKSMDEVKIYSVKNNMIGAIDLKENKIVALGNSKLVQPITVHQYGKLFTLDPPNFMGDCCKDTILNLDEDLPNILSPSNLFFESSPDFISTISLHPSEHSPYKRFRPFRILNSITVIRHINSLGDICEDWNRHSFGTCKQCKLIHERLDSQKPLIYTLVQEIGSSYLMWKQKMCETDTCDFLFYVSI